MINLNDLARDIHRWRHENFPRPTTSHWEPFLGMVEEIGELAHYLLKNRQQVREVHIADETDAICDVLIYLLHYCSDRGIDIEKELKATWDRVKQRNWKAFPKNGMTE